ncbi:MAG: 3-deoxy-7-phosphoheptulonate synthase [Clostridiales bacterium]
MIIVMRNGASNDEITKVENKLISLGFKTHPIYGDTKTVIGAIGDKRLAEKEMLLSLTGVETIIPIMKPFKLAGKELKKTPSIIKAGNVEIGGNKITIIAGPCAVESEKSFLSIAHLVKKSGANFLRGGAYKPRTSPYSFKGLEEDGLKIMAQAKLETGLSIVTEVVDPRDVELVVHYVDMLQIGARNMQNFRLLQEVGLSNKPVLLKRGLSATIEEWLMAAEYIISSGNPNVILCERGIRTFETSTRNTLDISAIPVVKENSHLPILVDPSHAAGTHKYIDSLSKAAIAAGADGLVVEVHNEPENAMSDGPQSLKPEKFTKLIEELKPVSEAVNKIIGSKITN